jgi:hypothetical protein
MAEIKKQVQETILAFLKSNNADRYFIELILCGNTALDREIREQNEEDLHFIFSGELPENCKIGRIKIQTEGTFDKDIFCRENIFAADLHCSFADETAGDFPVLKEILAPLKRNYGSFIDIDSISYEELTDDAENEILSLLTEDMS